MAAKGCVRLKHEGDIYLQTSIQYTSHIHHNISCYDAKIHPVFLFCLHYQRSGFVLVSPLFLPILFETCSILLYTYKYLLANVFSQVRSTNVIIKFSLNHSNVFYNCS